MSHPTPKQQLQAQIDALTDAFRAEIAATITANHHITYVAIAEHYGVGLSYVTDIVRAGKLRRSIDARRPEVN